MGSVKRMIKALAVSFWECICILSRKWTAFAHKMLFYSEWFYDAPHNFDHQIDLYYQWEKTRNPFWLERGVYNLMALQQFKHPKVLELCCGDGFNAYYFYSYLSDSVYAYDIDWKAIAKARKKYKCPHLIYDVLDIRQGLSGEVNKLTGVTNVIWDTAMAYFTPEEIDKIMSDIHEVLKETNGILSGHTIKKKEDKKWYQHKYEFESKEDLLRFFTPYFKNVMVFESEYSRKVNYYFYASDGEVPFGVNK